MDVNVFSVSYEDLSVCLIAVAVWFHGVIELVLGRGLEIYFYLIPLALRYWCDALFFCFSIGGNFFGGKKKNKSYILFLFKFYLGLVALIEKHQVSLSFIVY